MSALGDLDAQIAQRLFGWAIRSCESPCPFEGSRSLMGAYHEGWHDAAGRFFFAPPAYTTDPAATAQVWQWVDALGQVERVVVRLWTPESWPDIAQMLQ